MRYLAAMAAAFLFSFMLVSAPAFSQGDDKPAQQDEKAKDRDKAKENEKDRARPMDDRQAKPEERSTRPEEKGTARPDERNSRQDNDVRRENDARHDNDMRHDNNGARPAQGNGGYAQGNQRQEHRGQKIPQEKFRSSFGREHRFHVDRSRVYNQQQPVVVYGGYQFQLVDTWPSDWAYTDDCYIDYDDVSDQYYMYDYMHPGMRIAVFVIE